MCIRDRDWDSDESDASEGAAVAYSMEKGEEAMRKVQAMLALNKRTQGGTPLKRCILEWLDPCLQYDQ